jgi:uncharacterized protein YdhG (YjbR/CyaY superfamily)
MADTKKSTKRPAARDESPDSWTDDERAAMQERARELKAAKRRGASAKVDGEQDLLAKIAEMPAADRAMAEKIHAIVTASVPDIESKTWYGMPAYARDGKVVCFFQSAAKFKARYATLGFNDAAKLDDGTMWPTAFALTKLTAADEQRIGELVKQAVR